MFEKASARFDRLFFFAVAASLSSLSLLACSGNGTTEKPDLAPARVDGMNGGNDPDLSIVADLSVVADLDVANDLFVPPDLTAVDLVGADLTTFDLVTVAPDLAGADLAPRTCPVGTADCDDNHDDCETNTNTNAMHCGRCDHVCGGTATCVAGGCGATFVMDPTVSTNFCSIPVFSSDQVYTNTCWGGTSEIRKAPINPGSDITGTSIATMTVPVTAARGIALDADYVYYGVQGQPGTVFKYPANGTGVSTTAFSSDNNVRFDSLLLIGDTFYWADNRHTSESVVGTGTIRKRSKTDTVDTQLVTGLGKTYELIVTDTKLVWRETRSVANEWGIYQAPITGGFANAKLVQAFPAGVVPSLVQQGKYLYWTVNQAAPNGKIRRLDLTDDAAVPEDLVVNLTSPTYVRADASYLYYVSSGVVYRVKIDGSAVPEKLSQALSAPWLFYVDATYVYYASGAGPNMSLARVAK